METPTDEVKIKAQKCLNFANCLLGALGDSSLVSICLEQHKDIIPPQKLVKLEQVMNSREIIVRMGLEMALIRSIADCKKIVYGTPSIFRAIIFENVEKLLKAIIVEKRPVVYKPTKIDNSIEVHLSDRTVPISEVSRIGTKSLKLLKSWFELAFSSENSEISIDVSNKKSLEYSLYNKLRLINFIGKDKQNSPIIKYKEKSYKLYRIYEDGQVKLRVHLLDK